MMSKILVVTPFVLVLLLSCSSSHISSFRDPQLASNSYSKLLVATNLKYEYIDTFESTFSKHCRQNDIQPIYFWRLFPPIQTYDTAYVEKTISNIDADGVLLITFTDVAHTVLIPSTSTTFDFGWLNRRMKNPTWTQTSSNVTTPAHTAVEYTPSISAEIYSISTKQKVWVAYYSSSRAERPQLLFDIYSRNIFNALRKDSVIAK